MPSQVRPRRSSTRGDHKPTNERILAAARKVFYGKGFFPASVEEIADLAGVSRATVYLYYRAKEDMLFDLMRQDLDYQLGLYEELARIRRASVAALRTWLARLRGDLEQRRLSLNLFWAGANLKTDYLDPVFTHRDRIIAVLGERFPGFDLDARPPSGRELQRVKCYMMLFLLEGTTVQLIEDSPGPSVKVGVDVAARTLQHFLQSGDVVVGGPH